MIFNNIINNILKVHQLMLLVLLLCTVVGLSGCGDIWELAKNDVDDRRADYKGVDTINIVDSDTVGRNPDGVNAPTLYYQFIRTSLPLNSAPHLQRFNQELSGRPFQIEVYLQDGDLKLQDVTDRVLWNVVSQDCNGEPCYTINSGGRLIAGAKGKFSAQAEYAGLFTPVILFETPRKLETCGAVGNTDKVDDTQECLRIVMGSSGQAYGKWFTEPPRMNVMRYM